MTPFDKLKQIPLYEFVLSGDWGYRFEKKGSTRLWPKFTNGTNKIAVCSKPSSKGYYHYINLYTDEKGTVIDFLKMEGDDAKNHIKKDFKYRPPADETWVYQPPKIDTPAEVLERIAKFMAKSKGTHAPTKNYLIERGISEEVIKEYLRYGKYRAYTNPYVAVFPFFKDLSHKLHGEFHGMIAYYNRKIRKDYRFKITGLPKELVVLRREGEIDKVCICESPIDALSLECLHRRKNTPGNRAYIATCGTPSKHQLERLKAVIPDLPNVFIAPDNEPSGKRIAKTLKECLNVGVIFPETKDWNTDLNGGKEV